MAKGEIINNPLTKQLIMVTDPIPTQFSRELITVTSGKWFGDSWSGLWPVSSADLGQFLVPSLDPEFASTIESLKSQAVTSAHAKANSVEISMLMVAGEGRKTVASLASIFGRAIRIFKAVKTADIRYLKRQISLIELRDRYMEARYALRPMVYDVKGLIAALGASAESTGEKTRVTARSKVQNQYDKEDVIDVYPSGQLMKLSVKRKSTVLTEIRAGVLTDVVASYVEIWGLANFAETAWELIPLSFIADWFFNIGKTIAAWTPNYGIRELASWSVTKHVVLLENSLVSAQNYGVSPSVTRSTLSWSGSKTQTEQWTIREPSPQLGILPKLTIRLDALKLLDLAIILGNLSKNWRR
jgi:hypothetical protein